MSLKQTITSIGKMGRKDPLKMVFVLLLVSVLLLLVVGTLTEVLLQSRAAYPISGAAGSATQKVKFRSSFIVPPSCPTNLGQPCTNGSEVLIFYNTTSKTLIDVKIDNFFNERILSAGGRQQIIPPATTPHLTNSSGTETLEKLDAVAPGQEIYVAMKPTTTIREASILLNATARIVLSGKECLPASRVNCTNWSESSVELTMKDGIKALAPQKNNRTLFQNQYVVFSIDGFIIQKDGQYYYGTTQNYSSTFNKVSDNELLVTTRWDENNDKIILTTLIKKDASGWWIEKATFNNGRGSISTSPFPRYATSSAIRYATLYIQGPNDSFVLLYNPQLSTTWTTTEQSTGAAKFDLNNDSVLDLKDYTLLVNSFGKSGAANFVRADVNGDGKVNASDEDQIITQIKLRKQQKFN